VTIALVGDRLEKNISLTENIFKYAIKDGNPPFCTQYLGGLRPYAVRKKVLLYCTQTTTILKGAIVTKKHKTHDICRQIIHLFWRAGFARRLEIKYAVRNGEGVLSHHHVFCMYM